MLISEQFVMINFPKTGSSWCRTAIKKAHSQRMARLGWVERYIRRRVYLREHIVVSIADPAVQIPNQHGAVSQIPQQYRSLPIVSVVRNPFERVQSLYHFRWWETHVMIPPDDLKRLFPEFPNLSLPEVHELHLEELRRHTPGIEAGYQTVYFVRMYAWNPNEVLAKLNDEYVCSGRWRQDFADVRFLNTEDLRNQLSDFLLEHGFTENDVRVVNTIPPENVSSKKSAPWSSDLIQRVADDERWLLQMLDQLGHPFPLPQLTESQDAGA